MVLEKGYHQISIANEDIHKTGFTILKQHYEYLRMPLGLYNAPKTLQHVMQELLSHLSFVKIYLDDVLVYSSNEKKHKSHLNKVLKIRKNAGLVINSENSKYNLKEFKYLVRIINQNDIKIDTNELNRSLLNTKS